MKASGSLLDVPRDIVRSAMHRVAQGVNRISGGHVSPNAVTLVNLLAHIPIAWLIATRHPLKAALLLVVFGLFDSLDGELARLQKRASAVGMLLDSVSDRAKEVLLYVGVAYFVAGSEQPHMVAWVVAACGASLLVSYVNAWGEAVISRLKTSDHATNKSFRTGFMSYDIRMGVLVIGLLSGQIISSMIVIAVGSALTASFRLINVMAKVR